MKKIASILIGLTLILGLFPSCGNKPKNTKAEQDYQRAARFFTADESFSPIMEELIQVYEALNPKTKINALYTDEVNAVNLVLSDSMYMAVTSRRFTQEEFDNLKARDMLPEMVPLAYDGMALICNNQNTDSCITAENVRRILAGEVKNWNEINKGSNKGEIWVCFDNKSSSAVHYCVDSILGGKPINSPNIFAAQTSKEVIDYVEKTPNAIGIIGSNWLNDKRDTTNTTWNKNITVMSVSKMDVATPMNSWKPYQVWLLNNRYPFVRTIYALLNDPRRGLPWAFAHFIEQPKGQLIILKSGLLPTHGEIMIHDVNITDGK